MNGINMPTEVIDDLSGGLSTLSPTAMWPNQVNVAQNVEWFKTRCGERRQGHADIDLSGGPLEDISGILWIHRHLPTNDESEAQLWGFGLDSGTPVLGYKDTTWHTVTMPDAITLDGSQFKINAVSFHGKLFIAYNSSVDRLHLWEPGLTALRRVGLAQPPAAPTAADSGGAGSLSGTRYYRVRYTVQVGGVTKRRSEPSAVLTFNPSGTNASITVTKPATISEDETHWELEASTDNSNFYRIATTVVGTTTSVDSTSFSAGYASVGVLSEDAGDYTLIHSAKYLSIDDDRLMVAGSFEDENLSSRVAWTPVGLASGVGNDERLEADTDPSVDLDTYDGGEITGISKNVNGYIYVTKQTHVYQGLRTRNRARSYHFIAITKVRGAIPGTLVEAIDNNGHPTLFALDRNVGPVRIGGEGGGVQTCGHDLVEFWRAIGASAASSQATNQKAVYHAKKKQIIWIISATNSILVLHTHNMRDTDEAGFRGGWALWSLGNGNPESITLFADNIDAGVARSRVLVPFMSVGSFTGGAPPEIWRGDTGTDDAGRGFLAQLTTKNYVPAEYTNQFGVKEVALVGLSATDYVATVTVTLNRADYDAISDSANVSFAGTSPQFLYQQGRATRRLDGLSISEGVSFTITITDQVDGGGTSISDGWGLDAIVVVISKQQSREPSR